MGRVWGPGPTPSLGSLLPAAIRCQIPAPASPDPGVGPAAPPPNPTFQGSPGRSTCWDPVSPPTPPNPRAMLGAPSGAGRWGEETRGRDPRRRVKPARRRGAGTRRSEFVDTRSTELEGWAEGGRGGDGQVPASAGGWGRRDRRGVRGPAPAGSGPPLAPLRRRGEGVQAPGCCAGLWEPDPAPAAPGAWGHTLANPVLQPRRASGRREGHRGETYARLLGRSWRLVFQVPNDSNLAGGVEVA